MKYDTVRFVDWRSLAWKYARALDLDVFASELNANRCSNARIVDMLNATIRDYHVWQGDDSQRQAERGMLIVDLDFLLQQRALES